MGGIGTLYDELLPIYCSEDLADGGLGMTSGQIGQILMVCGCALMIFQMFGYSRLSKALGPLRLLYLSCWGHVLMMLLPAFGVLVSAQPPLPPPPLPQALPTLLLFLG